VRAVSVAKAVTASSLFTHIYIEGHLETGEINEMGQHDPPLVSHPFKVANLEAGERSYAS
jgi:hypothetical protein